MRAGTMPSPQRARVRTFAEGTLVQRTPQDCWAVLSDVARWPDWTPTMTWVEPLDDDWLALGTRFRIAQPGLRHTVWTVTELVPGQRFTWQSAWPGLRMVARHELAPLPGATLLTLGFEFHGLLAPLAAWHQGPTVRRFLDAEARGFRQHAETRPARG